MIEELEIDIRPIKIKLSVIESEDRLPSFKAELIVDIAHPTGNFTYTANNIWFDCFRFDDFITLILPSTLTNEVTLKSMSEEFVLHLSQDSIRIVINEEYPIGYITVLNHNQSIEPDEFYIIKYAFLRFNRWW